MRVKPTTSDGTPALEVDEYVKHVRNEYLHAYVHGGGASVKFVAGDEDTTTSYFSKRLENAACDCGYLHVRLDAAQTRVQFVEELFFAVSRNVDWVRLAADFLHRVYAGLDIPPDPGQPPEVSVQVRRVAEANGLHHGELYRTVRRRLERELLGENLLMHQFRVAMLRLCESLLDWVDTDADEHNIVLRWLRGHSVPVAELRTVGLHARVARHQARYMFNSLSRWVHMTGAPGIVVELDEPMTFDAGQYAEITVPGTGLSRQYSMANPPWEQRFLEFHVRRTPGGAATDGWMFRTLRCGDPVELTGPLGDFGLRAQEEPAILIAGGTGLAPLKSIVQDALARDLAPQLHLYHGGRTEDDLYDVAFFRDLAAEHPALTYRPCLSESTWDGAVGLVTDVVAEDFPSCRGMSAYLCGPPAMIEAGGKVLKNRRMAPRRIHREKFLDASHAA